MVRRNCSRTSYPGVTGATSFAPWSLTRRSQLTLESVERDRCVRRGRQGNEEQIRSPAFLIVGLLPPSPDRRHPGRRGACPREFPGIEGIPDPRQRGRPGSRSPCDGKAARTRGPCPRVVRGFKPGIRGPLHRQGSRWLSSTSGRFAAATSNWPGPWCRMPAVEARRSSSTIGCVRLDHSRSSTFGFPARRLRGERRLYSSRY